MAADPKMIPFLVGIGIRTISVDARQIPRVQQLIGQLDAGQAQSTAERLLRMGKISDVAAALNIGA
jgi:phosphotransferase system enzyme I (PtsP)